MSDNRSCDVGRKTYETLAVTTVAPYVIQVELNRPDVKNAMNDKLWKELRECFQYLAEDPKCRAIVLSGAGEAFTVGLDNSNVNTLLGVLRSDLDVARKCRTIYKVLKEYQETFNAIEKCSKPVISCVHSSCLGGGLYMIQASDMRYCTADAYFQLRGVEMGLISDVGGLQRFSKLIGNDGLVRELSFTGRELHSVEAEKCGFVSRVFPDKSSMIEAGIQVAESIAEMSPVAVQGTKAQLNYSRDHTIAESLEYQASWSMAMLQSEDLVKSVTALMNKTKAEFNDY